MSQELERVYTINLGKVLLSPNNQRAKRAINMIKEFARHHMKNEKVKIDESLSHLIWKRGIKHPPRKIRVSMTKTDEGFVLVSPYEEEIEETTKPKEEKKTPEVEEKPESESKETETSESKEESAPKKPESKKPQTKSKSKPKESKSKKQKPQNKKSKSKHRKQK
ncbi:MAG: 50S ribosomal protein L31e [Thaumarchaeota archaeon]|nr:50S ribosomal protein L31e [Nitrososphaerota archaeon]